MDNVTLINQQIAKNLTHYRKAAGLTQAELAEKINYSDKSVSKWESGNGAPDVYVLARLAEIFGVTVNDFLDDASPKIEAQKKSFALRFMIMLLSCGVVWLVATCLFVSMNFLYREKFDWWLSFIYAIPVCAVLLIVFAGIWHYKFLNFCATSLLIWTAILSIYLTSLFIGRYLGNDTGGAWLVFILGVPLQVLEVLWTFFRYLFEKNKKKKQTEKEEI